MQTHALALAEDLQKRGHDLRVLSYQSVTESDRVACEEIDPSLSFPVDRCLSRLGYFRNTDLVSEHVSSFRPDLIYSSTVFYGGVGEEMAIPVVCRSPGNDVLRPWIAWPYRPFSKLFSKPWFESGCYKLFKRLDYPKVLESLYYRKRRELVREAACKATLIYANSEFTAGHLERAGVSRERISLLVGGVDAKRFRSIKGESSPGKTNDSFVMVTACRLVHKKGIDFLIRSMPRIREKIPHAELMILGDGPKRRKYERLVSRLGLADCVTLTGRIPQKAIQSNIRSADVFVLASRLVIDNKTGNCDAETMGRVLCEANAASVPVVAARSGGIPSVIEDRQNGLLFESDNEESLLAALNEVFLNRALVDRMVDAGLKKAKEDFDWSVITGIHENDFENLVGRSGSFRETEPENKLQNV